MKIHTTLLLPVLLGGCSLPHVRPVDGDARTFVDKQIAMQSGIIALAQTDLKRATTSAQPARASPFPSSGKPEPAMVKPVTPPAPVPLRNLTRVRTIGPPPALTFISVSERDLKPDALLRKIIPPGWTVSLSADLKVKAGKSLSLQAADQWPYVLDALLRREGWAALIDWQARRVSVANMTDAFVAPPASAPPEAVKPPSPAAAPAPDGAKNPFTRAKSSTSTPSVTPPLTPPAVTAPAPVPPRWHAERGATLRDTLFIWAAQEKCATGQNGTWSVAWLTDVNYRIDAPLAFSGSFRDALDGVFRLYSAASVPLYAGISTAQCLLKVDDREVR